MAILTVEHRGARRAGTLNGLVLIGRWPINTIVIDEPSVSRIHAWIAEQDGRYYVGDAESRSGTKLNDEALGERHFLRDGDILRVGSAILQFRNSSSIGSDWETIDLTPRSLAELSEESGGTLMQCECGAPLWFPPHYAMTGRCRHCGSRISPAAEAPPAPTPKRVVKPPGPPPTPPVPPAPKYVPAEPAHQADATLEFEQADLAFDSLPNHEHALDFSDPAPPIAEQNTEPVERMASQQAAEPEEDRVCGVCHSAISSAEATATCPSCKLLFHADCWHENRGCSAYGCDQVNVLDARPVA